MDENVGGAVVRSRVDGAGRRRSVHRGAV